MHKVNHKRAVLAIAIFTFMLVGGSLVYSILGPSNASAGFHNVSAIQLATQTTLDGEPLNRGTYQLSTSSREPIANGDIQLALGRRNSFTYTSSGATTKGHIEFQATTDTYRCVSSSGSTLFRLKPVASGFEVIWIDAAAPHDGLLYFYKTK